MKFKLSSIALLTIVVFAIIGLLAMRFTNLNFLDIRKEAQVARYMKNVDECTKDKTRFKCWENIVTRILQEKGVAETIWYLERFREKDPKLASACHDYAHIVGEISYWLYEDRGGLELTDDTTLCEYGFYHGFMQEFGHHGENFLEDSPEVCRDLVENFFKEGSKKTTIDQCYHGIGHGLVFHYIDELGSNDKEIAQKAVPICLENFPEYDKDCVDGVYGGINLLYFGYHGYQIPVNEEDPFYLCREEAEPYKDGCYVNLSASIFDFYSNDLSRALSAVASLGDISSASAAVEGLASASSHHFFWEPDFYSQAIGICQDLDRGLNNDCLRGLAQGILNRARPQERYELAVNLCQDEKLKSSETEACLEGIFTKVFHQDLDSMDRVCSLVSEEYKSRCR